MLLCSCNPNFVSIIVKIRCYSISYPQLEMWPRQSWAVTDENIIASSARGIDDVWNTLFCFMTLLTWLNTPSAGFRSGEYGERKHIFAPAWFSTRSITFSTWWILALSIITTDRGLIPLKGFRWGKRTSLTNLVKRLPFIVPSVMSTSWIPSRDSTGIAVYLVPLS